ncbi:aspartate dehydrogenase [Eubacterium sp. AM46-8]|nr:aspartate dehydrogenase [Eubacterium sp. AM46-8]
MLSRDLYNDYKSRTGARKLIDKMNKKPVLKTSICTGEQVAGFQDIHTGKIEEIMLIKQAADIDTFKQMYGIDGEIPKVY